MKNDSSSDVSVLVADIVSLWNNGTALFFIYAAPWQRKLEHRIGHKATFFQKDFTCKNPLPDEKHEWRITKC